MSEENVQAATPETVQGQAPASELPQEQTPADGGAAEAQQPAPSVEAQPEGEGSESEEAQSKKRERFDRRFSDLTRRAREAELKAARLEGELAAMRRQPQAQEPAQPAQAPAGPPDPKSYAQGEFDPLYLKDLARHEAREIIRAEREEAMRNERQRAVDAEIAQGAARLEDALKAASDAAYASEHFENAPRVLELAYVPVAQGGLPRHVVDAITTSENAVHVAEVLGRNPDHVAESLRKLVKAPHELARMSPLQAAAAIAKLDDRIGLILEQQRRAAQTAEPKPAAAAVKPAPQASPAPIPTAPNGAAGAPSFDPSKGSMDDYVRWRESQQ